MDQLFERYVRKTRDFEWIAKSQFPSRNWTLSLRESLEVLSLREMARSKTWKLSSPIVKYDFSADESILHSHMQIVTFDNLITPQSNTLLVQTSRWGCVIN